MKNKILILFTGALLMVFQNVMAQTTLPSFANIHVTAGTLNGKNVSDNVNNNLSFDFYSNDYGKLTMKETIYKPNKIIYGEIVPIYTETINATKEIGRTEQFYFGWDYKLTKKDGKVFSGHAIVIISEIHTPIGLGFKIKIIDGQLRQIINLSGFTKGKVKLAGNLANAF